MTPHVLILIENEGYPHDVRVRRHAEALAAEDYSVTVVCPRQVGERSVEVFAGVRILRYPLKAGARGPLSYLTEYAAAAGLGRLMMRVRRQGPIDVVIACNPPD
ncbi:MAG: glycosyltransferase, partial [Solirubrobacteraceae bacterium]